MNADAAALRDIARDMLRRHRPTAAREITQQVANTANRVAIGLAGRTPPCTPLPGRLWQIAATNMLQCCRNRRSCQVACTQRHAQRVRIALFELFRYLAGRYILAAKSCQFAIENVTPLAKVLIAILVTKPVAHLGAAACACQIAQLRAQPVAAGL